MIKWRAGPPEYFQSFLEYCYKSLDVWGVEYCIILHEEKRLEGWRRWNLLFLLCARELHMMVRVWWCSDLELGETINVFDLILAWNVTSNYYTCLDVGEKKHGSSEHYCFPIPLGFVCCSCTRLSIIFCNYRSPAICFSFHDQFMFSVSQSTFTTYCFLDSDHLVCVDALRVASFRLFLWLMKILWDVW